MNPDPYLGVLDAAYAPIADEEAWLARMVDSVDTLGLGEWTACSMRHGKMWAASGLRHFIAIAERACSVLPHDIHVAAHTTAPRVQDSHQAWERVCKRFGCRLRDLEEQVGYSLLPITAILAFDTDATGVGFYSSEQLKLAPRTRRVLMHLAAHVASAYRLRASLDATPEGVCDPNGRLIDGSAEAVTKRAELGRAARAIDASRLRRTSTEQALAAWTALVEGRWTLVENVERDGKRYFLVHRNEPPSTLGALAKNEARTVMLAARGHSDKAIAYELGIQRSTVASHLRGALRKLKLRDRRDLVKVFGPLAQLNPSPTERRLHHLSGLHG
ncbi:MAG: hypothetical protein KIT72_16625 [Polyangiaceae bacterium]|nr:hypothetical protein [Polyangiaceae bacterium]MCW5792043.1 hypothetical protein [Polyangiaceae bacterium]